MNPTLFLVGMLATLVASVAVERRCEAEGALCVSNLLTLPWQFDEIADTFVWYFRAVYFQATAALPFLVLSW